jgi:hypothetical protein
MGAWELSFFSSSSSSSFFFLKILKFPSTYLTLPLEIRILEIYTLFKLQLYLCKYLSTFKSSGLGLNCDNITFIDVCWGGFSFKDPLPKQSSLSLS